MEKDGGSAPNNVVHVDFKGKSSPLVHGSVLNELNQKKRELFAAWLKAGTVCVLFDARDKAVKVPKDLKERGDLRLNFCYNFHLADFNFNDTAVFATLSFDDGEHFCSVPWSSVYGLQSAVLHQGAVWFDSFPVDQDQVSVLGFSEEMCEQWSTQEPDNGEHEPNDADNIIELDFSNR